jgi:hypothetical protein
MEVRYVAPFAGRQRLKGRRSTLMRQLLAVGSVTTLFFMSGCSACGPKVGAKLGEVAYLADDGTQVAVVRDGLVDFGIVEMGASKTQPLTLRNVGSGPLSFGALSKVMGAADVRVGTRADGASAFEVPWPVGEDVAAGRDVTVQVSFNAPIIRGQRVVEFEVTMEHAALNSVEETALTKVVLKARAVAAPCELPETIDFGSVLVRGEGRRTVLFENQSIGEVKGSSGPVMSGTGESTFRYETDSPQGQFSIEPGSSREVALVFAPTEARDYVAAVQMRRTATCPAQTVRLKGRGVTSCVSWRASPSDDMGNRLHFGAAMPGSTATGQVTFINVCALPVSLTELRTSASVFSVTQTNVMPVDVSQLSLPSAKLDAGTWVDGEATLIARFAPTTLVVASGTLTARTNLVSQPGLTVPLRGVGGGPDIDVRPANLNFGRVGFFAGAMPPFSAQRSLAIVNVGVLPNPRDAFANLRLGRSGDVTTAFSVRAITGTLDELCIGGYDAAANQCLGSLRYDPRLGIEASPGSQLGVPVRVIPRSLGLKEWELTIASNDPDEPEVVVKIRADVQELPPCNYDVAPPGLNFGLVNANLPKELSFTVTNRGTQPQDICYFSGFEVDQTSDPAFSVGAGVVDPLELMPQASATIAVKVAPTTSPTMSQSLTGRVTFNVPNPAQPVGKVDLLATLGPSCLTIMPATLDFGRTEMGCNSPDRALQVFNSCSTPVTLGGYRLVAASVVPTGTGICTDAAGCPEFQVTSSSNFTGTLLPGASRALSLKYSPADLGADTGSLAINAMQNGAAVDYLVTLRGLGEAPAQAGQCSIVAVCPAPRVVDPNSTVPLMPSYTSSGGAVTCGWGVGQRPSTSQGAFGNGTSCTNSSYFADVVGTHVLRFSVMDAAGRSSSCDTTVTVQPRGEFWVELTWDLNNDVDLHVLHPNGGNPLMGNTWGSGNGGVGTGNWDCYYANCTTGASLNRPSWDNPGAQDDPNLDRDDVLQRGPENTRINTPVSTHPYIIGVHMYNYAANQPVTSTLKLYCAGQLVTTQTRQMSQTKDMWVVGSASFANAGLQGCVFSPTNMVVNSP